ncbi:MAG TPA: dihydrodipicolinate synthase family protein [Candidatus Kapabacteria bacterium]|nr:dihydrodipicolinate synthase family protein [Candidatus Kapabacteria bacterium]
MNPTGESLIRTIRHGLIPAVPVPFRKDTTIHEQAQEQYVRYMAEQPIAGVAVWAHTGRGLHLTVSQREYILKSWRAGIPDKPIIAGVGGDPHATKSKDFVASARAMAQHAVECGADAFLVYAPTFFRPLDISAQEKAIIEYHAALAEYGKPLIIFFLYEAAGGITYSDHILRELLSLQSVAGIKIATLDSVMTFQNIAAIVSQNFPEKLLITGEDRFFGYTLMCGAQAALVGMGSACCQLQADMMKAYYEKHVSFIELSNKVDMLSFVTFDQPMEGYIERMLCVLAEQKVIPEDAVHDPWGPAVTEHEKEQISRVLPLLHH